MRGQLDLLAIAGSAISGLASVNWGDLLLFIGVVLLLALAFDGFSHPNQNFFDLVRDRYDSLLSAPTESLACDLPNLFGGGLNVAGGAIQTAQNLPATNDTNLSSRNNVQPSNSFFQPIQDVITGALQPVLGATGIVAGFIGGILRVVGCGFLMVKLLAIYGGLSMILIKLFQLVAPLIFS